jgi:hypothetical protein
LLRLAAQGLEEAHDPPGDSPKQQQARTATDEVLRHPGILLTPPDRTPLPAVTAQSETAVLVVEIAGRSSMQV